LKFRKIPLRSGIGQGLRGGSHWRVAAGKR
jgi:hypothetical protein